MTITPLTERLTQIGDVGKIWTTDPDRPDNEGWQQFVLDHQARILANAVPLPIDPNAFSEVRYDIARFFRQQNLSLQYLWVARVITPNLSDETFDRIRVIYIPNADDMKTLYEQFRASSIMVKR